jgi:hypothetical protein
LLSIQMRGTGLPTRLMGAMSWCGRRSGLPAICRRGAETACGSTAGKRRVKGGGRGDGLVQPGDAQGRPVLIHFSMEIRVCFVDRLHGRAFRRESAT